VKIYSHSNGSKGARMLAAALGTNLISHTESQFIGAPNKFVVNWGAAKLPEEVAKCVVLNRNIQKDKFEMLKVLSTKFDVPAFTKSIKEAKVWEDNEVEVTYNEGVFYSNIHFRRVFRIHQFPGKSVRVQYKEDIALKEATKTLIKQTCEDVRKFLELDFCAINIGWDEERFFILNVNTAPELDEDLARVYAKHIKELV
jgi:hypothetical protein